MLRADGRFAGWGRGVLQLFADGIEERMAAVNAMEIVHHDDRAFFARKLGEVLEQGRNGSFEVRVLVNGGKDVRRILIDAAPADVDGERAVAGICIDITRRNRLESLSDFRLSLYQASTDSSLEELLHSAVIEAVKLTDSAHAFFHLLNSDLQNLPRRVWSGDPVACLEDPAVIDGIVRQKAQVIDNDGWTSYKGVRNLLAVPVIEDSTVVAVLAVVDKRLDYDEDDARWVAAIADLAWNVIARKRAELSESRIQTMLIQVQKMELVGQLAGGIAHDFNNMLGVILGNTEIALSDDSINEELRHILNEIYTAAERSAAITGQLLAFARKQFAVPKVLDLNDLLPDTIAMLKRLIGERITLASVLDSKSCRVKIDPAQLDQILTNLCVNARDAISGQGRITIETRRTSIEASSEVDGAFRHKGEYVELMVSDNGQGIKPADLPHIFEPFFTTKSPDKGTGLGLATVYGIVKQNNGFIEFDSRVGAGSVFRIFLPFVAAAGEMAPAAVSGTVGGAGGDAGKATILVVEDEPEILNLCSLMLRKTGFRVLTALTPLDAFTIAEEWQGKIDLVLSDVVMPEMNGNDLARQLQHISPGFRTLFMSGYTADIIACHGVLEPGVNFIHKPFTVMALANKVREVLAAE